ncbi:MAG: ester cyclase [Acidobacteriota bacterium]
MSAAAIPERNKVLVRRAIDEIWNKGNLSTVEELYDANCVRHDPAAPEFATGLDNLKQQATLYRTAFPDLEVTIEDMIVEGDKVVTRWSSKGTHRGELQGIAPTGREVTSSGISIALIANGKIIEERVNWDNFGLMKQLGAIE